MQIATAALNIPLKKLLMLLDMASTGENGLSYEDFIACYNSVQIIKGRH